MQFMFGIPSFVHFGEGVSQKLGETAAGMGAKKAFVVYDKGVKAAGIVDGLIASLKAAGVEAVEYDGVLPNPPDTQVEEAAAIARSADVDIIVAVGGGSSIDSAKAINILLTNPSPINQYDGINTVKAPGKPLIAIPTTAGTASEVTAFSIVTDTARKKKMVIGGQFVGATLALADPLLTVAMPPKITASTGLDALTHAIEAYVSKWAMIPTDVLALKAIELIRKNIVTATKNGSCVEARSAMLLGSMMAGFAFTNAVLGLVHSIAHPLSAHFNLPHGVANAIGLPYVMEYNMASAPARFRDIAVALGIDVTGMSDAAAAQAAVDLVKSLNRELEIPTLKECGITRDMFDLIAEDALKEVSTLFNPRDPSKEDILAILEKAY
ncbi:MAG TPA: iron-containing alcohol dehydrogenase [Geobacteraceae bacterium]|nr:iron-containing alcohol dehydrogenase [Geobacteraceae bacterium]